MALPAKKTQAYFTLLLLFAASCGLFANDDGRPMSLRVLEGEAVIIHDGERTTTTSEAEIAVGDRILISEGIAELRLLEGRLFELEDAEAEVSASSEVILSSGRLLADLAAAARVGFEEGVAFSARGAFRVDRGLGTRVGSYSGATMLSGDGVDLPVPTYREAVVAGGVIPTVARPLRISANDRWDRRYLQAALDLDARLINFGRGLEAQLGALSGLPFFGQVLPSGSALEFLAPFLDQRRSDVLIGLMIALDSSDGDDPARRFRQVFDLWARGASWGLIAVEFGAGANSLFTLLLDAIAAIGLNVVTGGGGALVGPAQPPSGGPPGGGRGGGGGTTPGPPGPGSPGPSPTPDPVTSIVDEVGDTTEEVECTIQGLLGDPCPN